MQNINFIGQPTPTPNDCAGQVIPTDNGECANASGPLLHNSLDGLQGGTVSERYHLTKVQHDGLVNPLGTFMDLTTNQTADGIKTFLQSPQVPVGSSPADAVQFSQLAEITIILAGDNGVLVTDNSLIELGAPLIRDTEIDQGGFVMLFSGGPVQVDTAPLASNDLVRLSDLDYLDSVLSGLTLTVVSTNVTVSPGQWRINNIKYATASTTTLPLDTQDGSLSRYDAVYADTSNSVHIVSGTLSSSPAIPAIPSNTVLVGTILITPTSFVVTQEPINGYVDLISAQTIGGIKTFTDVIFGLNGLNVNNGPTSPFIVNGTSGAVLNVSNADIHMSAVNTTFSNTTSVTLLHLGDGSTAALSSMPHLQVSGTPSLPNDVLRLSDLNLAPYVTVAAPILIGTSIAGYVWTATDTVGNGSWQAATGGGGGGVSSIAVTTANGVSGTSSGGSNPSLTLALGAITPTSINVTTSGAIINSTNSVVAHFNASSVGKATINADGIYYGTGISNFTGGDLAIVLTTTGGTFIKRSNADVGATSVVSVVSENFLSAGLLIDFVASGRGMMSMNVNGTISHNPLPVAAGGFARSHTLQGGIKPTANSDSLTGLRVSPTFGKSTIATFNTLVAGSGYIDSTFYSLLTGGTGMFAVANVTVSGGVVTSATVFDGGINYTVGDVLTINQVNGSGSPVGSGATVRVASITTYASLVNVSAEFVTAPIRLTAITTPTTFADGMIWNDGTHLYGYINGAARQLDQQTGGGTGVSSITIATAGGVSGTSSGGGTPVLTFTLRNAVREAPSGALNGTNVTFGLVNTPLTGKEMLFLNGILLNSGDDYTISGATITMLTAPVSSDKLLAFYPY